MLRLLFANPDEKLSQIYIRNMQPHFQIDSAFDGLSALRRFKLIKPNIVISEYHMPLLSGLSLLKFIRGSRDHSMTPFLFLSNHHDNTDALSFGANDWLDIKHTHPDLLLAKIYHHMKINKHAIQIH